jgi:glycosyltransferase involved in cell wall biosynthesis
MEAMACGIPVVANATGALPELLANGRGWIVPWQSWYYDPFGNQRRYDVSIEHAVQALLTVRANDNEGTLSKARKFMESKDWDKSALQIDSALKKLENGT